MKTLTCLFAAILFSGCGKTTTFTQKDRANLAHAIGLDTNDVQYASRVNYSQVLPGATSLERHPGHLLLTTDELILSDAMFAGDVALRKGYPRLVGMDSRMRVDEGFAHVMLNVDGQVWFVEPLGENGILTDNADMELTNHLTVKGVSLWTWGKPLGLSETGMEEGAEWAGGAIASNGEGQPIDDSSSSDSLTAGDVAQLPLEIAGLALAAPVGVVYLGLHAVKLPGLLIGLDNLVNP